jgi:AcrR family transcriptional regulator
MPKIVDHEVRRSELADAVLAVVARHGTNAVTLRAVADESGWSTGTLGHYAGNREGLLKVALQRAAAVTRRIYLSAGDDDPQEPLDRLDRALSETLPLDARRLALTRIFIFYYAEAGSESGSALGSDIQLYLRNWRSDIATCVSAIVDAGLAPADTNVAESAEVLVALADGFGNQAALDDVLLERLRSASPVRSWIGMVLGVSTTSNSMTTSARS